MQVYLSCLPLDSSFVKEKADMDKFGETLNRLEIEIIKLRGNTEVENRQKYIDIEAALKKQIDIYYHKLFFIIKSSDLHEKLAVHKKNLDMLVKLHRSKGDDEMSDSNKTTNITKKSKLKSISF